MRSARFDDRPRFVRVLQDTFRVNVAERLQPLYRILDNDDVRVTQVQGFEAVDSLRALVLDVPNIVGAGGIENFLIGHVPLDYRRLTEPDGVAIAAWQSNLGDLYRLGLSECLYPNAPGAYEDLRMFHMQLTEFFTVALDEILYERVMYWAEHASNQPSARQGGNS